MLRKFKGKLILNMKTGDMRVVKKGQLFATPYDVTVGFTVEVEAPEPEVQEVSAKVVIPRKQFNRIVLDSI